MELELIEVFNGISEIIFVSITIVIGCLIMMKYKKTNNKIFLIVGFVWIGIAQPWLAGVVSFFYTLITAKMISLSLYLLIGFQFLSFTAFLWGFAFTELVYKEKQLIFLLIIGIWFAIFEILFLYFLFTDPSLLATLHSPLVIEYKLFIQIFLLSIIVLALLTGVLFVKKTKRSDNPEHKLRGNFLLLAFILLTIGSLFDTIYVENILIIIIKRSILIFASFAFYCSFILPERIKNLFLK